MKGLRQRLALWIAPWLWAPVRLVDETHNLNHGGPITKTAYFRGSWFMTTKGNE